MNSLEESRSLMQEEIDSEKDIEERRKYGQFSTPFTLAQEIIIEAKYPVITCFLSQSVGIMQK